MTDPFDQIDANRRATYRAQFTEYRGLLDATGLDADDVLHLDGLLVALNISPAEGRTDRDTLKRARELAPIAAELPERLEARAAATNALADFQVETKQELAVVDARLHAKSPNVSVADFDGAQAEKARITQARDVELQRLSVTATTASIAAEQSQRAVAELAQLRASHALLLADVREAVAL